MKIIFIGNRANVLKHLIHYDEFDIEILCLKDSYLEKDIQNITKKYRLFTLQDKTRVIANIMSNPFDILISNGCPFILPTNEMKSKILINIHPTYLPYLRGKTPLNGVYFNRMKFIGATMHYMNQVVDAGNIIYQKKIKLTDDLDLGLVYFLSFYLEGVVFKKGFEIFKKNNFNYEGTEVDISSGSFFNRTKNINEISFQKMCSDEIIKIIKAFGIKSQGVKIKNKPKSLKISRIYEAVKIKNNTLLKIFSDKNPGEVVYMYDGKILIKTIDGLIKIVDFQ